MLNLFSYVMYNAGLCLSLGYFLAMGVFWDILHAYNFTFSVCNIFFRFIEGSKGNALKVLWN